MLGYTRMDYLYVRRKFVWKNEGEMVSWYTQLQWVSQELKASFTFSTSPGLFFQLGRSSVSSWSFHCSWGLQTIWLIMSHPEFNLITISGYFVIWLDGWKSHRRSDLITLLYFPRFLKLHDMTIVFLAGCSMLTQGTKKVLLKKLTQGKKNVLLKMLTQGTYVTVLLKKLTQGKTRPSVMEVSP